MEYEEYSDKIYHHPCRIFRDYFATKSPSKALEELFYSALFAYFNIQTAGKEFYVQAPPHDPPDAKMIIPDIEGNNIAYRDIEVFKVKGFNSEADILDATKVKMENKYYGEDYVLLGVLQPNDIQVLDVEKLKPLFEKEKFTLGHIFFILPTAKIQQEKVQLEYVLVQVQPIFTYMIINYEDLLNNCNQKKGGFFYELAGKGKKNKAEINKQKIPSLIPNKRS